MIQLCRCRDYEDISQRAAELLTAQLTWKKDSTLGLATGGSPVGLYRKLRERFAEGLVDFSEVKTVNLDEYRGLAPENPQSYRYFMEENLFRHVNIHPENTYVPNGLEKDSETACRDYDAVIQRLGGIDLQLLGIGRNGHIGFNEPSDQFSSGTHCVKLSENTIEANQRFFERREEVPTEAYTMGCGAILRARRILLLASGRDKAEAVHAMLYGPITPQLPASILQLHENVLVLADEEALGQ